MKPLIIILAAGQSTRMGHPKQLLAWGGETLLRHAVRQALGIAGAEVWVILGSKAEEIGKHLEDLPVRRIVNKDFRSGMGSSIAAGISEALASTEQFDRALIMLADQPSVNTAWLSRYFEQAEESPARVIATDYGGRPGVPALFPAYLFPDLIELSGAAGAKFFLAGLGDRVINLIPPGRLYDIDTPEDYERHEGDQEHN